MQVRNEYPPNYEQIRLKFKAFPNTVYCFGETIYNPDGIEVPEDIIYHEWVHSEQQKVFGTPELWWAKYIVDAEFRTEQEVEAYAKQFQWIRKHTNSNIAKLALEEMSVNLSSPMYKTGLTYQQAFTRIRKYAV